MYLESRRDTWLILWKRGTQRGYPNDGITVIRGDPEKLQPSLPLNIKSLIAFTHHVVLGLMEHWMTFS